MSEVTYTKAQLTAILTEAGIAIPRKANVATLTALHTAHLATLAPAPEAEQFDTGINFLTASEDAIRAADCPHCGIGLDNGLLHATDESADGKGSYLSQRDPGFLAGEWMCMGCGGHFGQPVTYPEPAAPPASTGLKIEKDRPERNGIKRPSAGGKCRAIWDAMDAFAESTGDDPTAKDVRDLAAQHGWNPNNASIEFYQWRKFNGITKATPAVVPPAPATVDALAPAEGEA